MTSSHGDSKGRAAPWATRLFTVLALLYIFCIGLDMMGLSFKLFGKGFAQQLLTTTANPLVGLFIGVLATTLVQSSSTTTSIVVGLVAAGAISIEGAIPLIMGANIGTSVTNTIVSLGHASRREEFRRAFAGATVHDFFNWLAVLVLLPIEVFFGPIQAISTWMTEVLDGVGGVKLFNPLREVVRPAAEALSGLVNESGVLTLLIGIALLFFALRYLVRVLRSSLTGEAEQILHRTLFRSATAAVLAGIAVTVMVQSSSVTTSAIVPLVGAGVISLEQLFPLTIGANIGTTVTAMLAALATGESAAITVAFSHLTFNIMGTLIFFVPPPLRRVPLAMARWMGDLAARNRAAAAAYVLGTFYGVPLLLILLTGAFGDKPDTATTSAPDTPAASASVDPTH